MVAQVPFFTHFMFRDHLKNFVHLRGWQGGLGTGMGVALGAKLANPAKMVVFVVGDGAFNYNALPASFGFAQQYNCPILIAVMNNSGYISQTWNFYKHFPQGYALSTGNTHGNVIEPAPKYAQLPLAWGGLGIEVSEISDDEESLKKGAFKELFVETVGTGGTGGTGEQLGPQLTNTLLLDVKVSP
jgi:acetolactate synthase-1/2/3 large subunit